MTLKFPEELIINGDEWKIQPFRFDVHAINTGSYTPSYRDVTVTGVSPLNLPNAEANGLRYIKLFGKCEQTPNLFDKDTATLNYYINSSGEEQANASWSCSDYIEVTVGKPYNLSGVSSYGSSPRTGFYAADKSFVSSRSQSSADFTIPDGVKYMRVSVYKTSINTATVKQIFTLDKYTIVGTLTFNGDIVSGFSNGNYIKTPIINWGNTFTLEMKAYLQSDTSSGHNLISTTNNQGINIWLDSSNKIRFRVGNGSTWVSGEIVGSTIFSDGIIYIKYTYDGTAYTLYSSLDGETWTTENSYASATNVLPNGKTANIGTARLADTGYWSGSIDLKGFKLIVDGVTTTIVGNPIPILCNNGSVGSTEYTVVGTPTISSDLVVSGFSSSNYINFTPNVILSNDFEIIVDFITGNDLSTDQSLFRMMNGSSFIAGLILYASSKEMRVSFSDGTTGPALSGTFRASENTHYKMKFKLDNGTFYYYYKGDNDSDWVLSGSSTTTMNIQSPITSITMGRNNAYTWGGSIDLKGFKITVNGIPVRLPETVRILGKNLFDQSQLLKATDWSLNSDGYYNGLFANFSTEFTSGFEIDVPFKEKTVYTLSCKGYVSDEGARARFIFVYTDETSKSLTIDGTSPAEYTLTTSSTKTLAKIRGSYASGASSTLYLKDIQLEEGSSATAFQPYHASPTAVARDLLSCGDDYVDEQNVTTGEITRKVGVYVFDGTENWRKSASQPSSGIRFQANTGLANRAYGANLSGLCTHFNTVASSAIQQDINTFVYSTFNEYIFVIVDSNNFPTVDDWTSYVASLYTQGKPIIITYPLATPTTETVVAQDTLQNVEGLNTLYITQSAIDGLSMEVTYSAGVEVTIEAVQNANVDQQVEVTIGE